VDATIEEMFATAIGGAEARNDDSFEQQMKSLGSAMMATGNPRALAAWWLYRMVHTPDPLTECVTLFWHDHFATSAAKVTKPRLMRAHYELLRRHAFGEFAPFVQAMSRDPAMLIWLDSTTNRRISPNENYARELMELFCLGVGNYTEGDIKEVARAFTGWEVRRDRFVFNSYQHDARDKTFLAHTGKFNGDDAVRVVLDHPAAPRFIARKLVRYFVCDEPELSDRVIEPLAQQLRGNGFAIAPIIRRVLASNLFFSQHAIGRKVRSPVTLGVGTLRALGASGNMNELAAGLDQLGQLPLFPPSVKGWDGGRAWINSSSLLLRANLMRAIGEKAKFAEGSFVETARAANVTGPDDAVEWLLRLLVPVDVPNATRRALTDIVTGSGDENQRMICLLQAIGSLPEFNLA